MNNKTMLVAVGSNPGLTSCSATMLSCIVDMQKKANYFIPIIQEEQSNSLAEFIQSEEKYYNTNYFQGIDVNTARDLISKNQKSNLLDKIMSIFYEKKIDAPSIIEGMNLSDSNSFAMRFNSELAKALDARVIFIVGGQKETIEDAITRVKVSAQIYGGYDSPRVIGTIINKALKSEDNEISKSDKIIGVIPHNHELSNLQISDILNITNGKYLYKNTNHSNSFFNNIHVCSGSTSQVIMDFEQNTLLIANKSQDDILLAVSLAVSNNIKLPGLIVCGEQDINEKVQKLCAKNLNNNLDVISTSLSATKVSQILYSHMMSSLPLTYEIILNTVKYFNNYIFHEKLIEVLGSEYAERLSPAGFRYYITKKSKSKLQNIILPEGEEHRIIQAALECQDKKIANCILLGEEEKIRLQADNLELKIPSQLQIFNPINILDAYVEKMVEIRKHKGMNKQIAKAQLEQDNIVLATMMLANGDVSGMVAGAINTTANTIRPALQLIKSKPENNIISSSFFMCLPEKILIYADCAINPYPSASDLAEIAIQTAETAQNFNIEPKIAMISYATGNSANGKEIEKVITATKLVKEKRPDLLIDGPLQYDAATSPVVAKLKAPTSKVAGTANIFIFPDLNTGNTTYKAVQRSSGAISIGPILQGLNKPVNDLSRGASVKDIVYTIAITAIQAQQNNN